MQPIHNRKFMIEVAPTLDMLLAHDWQVELLARSDSGQDTIVVTRGERWSLELWVGEGLTDDVSWVDRSTLHFIRLDGLREAVSVLTLSDESLVTYWDNWSARHRKSVTEDGGFKVVPVND